jgi:hypothetical protein
VGDDALDDLDGVLRDRRLGAPDPLGQHLDRLQSTLVGLEEDVQRALAGLRSSGHLNQPVSR